MFNWLKKRNDNYKVDFHDLTKWLESLPHTVFDVMNTYQKEYYGTISTQEYIDFIISKHHEENPFKQAIFNTLVLVTVATVASAEKTYMYHILNPDKREDDLLILGWMNKFLDREFEAMKADPAYKLTANEAWEKFRVKMKMDRPIEDRDYIILREGVVRRVLIDLYVDRLDDYTDEMVDDVQFV